MKTAARNIILFFSILYSSAAYTQTAWIDSVKKVLPAQKEDTNKVSTLISLSWAYRFSYPDSGLVYAQKALSLAEKLNSEESTFWSLVSINQTLYILGNYALELDYAFKEFSLAKKINTPFTIAVSKGQLTDCYRNLGEYNTALKYWREVVKITEQSYPDERPKVYGNSSRIFEDMHQYDSALIYAKRSYELFEHNPLLNKENDDSKFIKSAYLPL